MKEDIRTFREFYPDPEERHEVHHAFAHRFLPWYVQQNPYAFFSYLFRPDLTGGPMDPTQFIQSRWAGFEARSGFIQTLKPGRARSRAFRRVSDLGMLTRDVEGRPTALVLMPRPEQPPEAFFVAVVLLAAQARPVDWPRDVQARIFTLEEFRDPPDDGRVGVLCEWTKAGDHRNTVRAIQVDPDSFVQAVADVLRSPAEGPEDSTSPSILGLPPS